MPQSTEQLIEVCLIEGAVPFLNHHRVRLSNRKIRVNLGTDCSFDGDPNTLGFHFSKSIAEIRLEFLANPNDRMATLTHDADEVVDRPDQPLLWRRCPLLKNVIHHVNDD